MVHITLLEAEAVAVVVQAVLEAAVEAAVEQEPQEPQILAVVHLAELEQVFLQLLAVLEL